MEKSQKTPKTLWCGKFPRRPNMPSSDNLGAVICVVFPVRSTTPAGLSPSHHTLRRRSWTRGKPESGTVCYRIWERMNWAQESDITDNTGTVHPAVEIGVHRTEEDILLFYFYRPRRATPTLTAPLDTIRTMLGTALQSSTDIKCLYFREPQ